jgi:Tfp pilus assembly protein PilN
MKELNLIPDSIKEKRRRNKLIIYTALISVVAIVLILVATFIPYYSLQKKVNEEATLKASVDKFQTVKVENDKLKKEAASYNNYIALIDKVQKSNVTVYPIFKNLEKYIPQDVVLKTFAYNLGIVNISATCKQYDSMSEFLANLQESKEFPKGNITNITKNETSGDYTFALIIDLKGEVK